MRTYCSGRTPFGAIRPLLQDNMDGNALVDSCPAHGSASRKRTLRSGRTLISIYLFLISLFVFLFWDSGEKRKKKRRAKQTGHVLKRDYLLYRYYLCK